jgi:D-glycero-D-manno-heptose 1,7-bisphosphate phosphatase
MKRFSAIFVDRDGVINRAGLREYVWLPERFEFLPGAIEGLRALRGLCDRLIVITNQAGIGRGLYSERQYRDLRDWYHASLKEMGILIDAEYFCPHHPTEGKGNYGIACECRKPGTAMLRRAAETFIVDLKRSCVIGDAARDVEMAKTAGCLAIHVATGPDPMKPRSADMHFQSLKETAEHLRRIP